jgi:hypothetical protein
MMMMNKDAWCCFSVFFLGKAALEKKAGACGELSSRWMGVKLNYTARRHITFFFK